MLREMMVTANVEGAIEGLTHLVLLILMEQQLSDHQTVARFRGMIGSQRDISDAGLNFASDILSAVEMQYEACLRGGLSRNTGLGVVPKNTEQG